MNTVIPSEVEESGLRYPKGTSTGSLDFASLRSG